jgi:hypothetical protein
MPSLTNFLTTFKYKCNKIVKQHYLELWTKQAHSLKEGKLRTYLKISFTILLHLFLKVDVLSVKKLVNLGIFCKICCTEPYHDGCLPSYKFSVHLITNRNRKVPGYSPGKPNLLKVHFGSGRRWDALITSFDIWWKGNRAFG